MNNNKKFTKRGKYSKNSGKGGKGKNRGFDSESKVTRTSDVVNDASYYFGSDSSELSAGLNSYSFSDFLGVPSKLMSIAGVPYTLQTGNIMTLYLNPSASYVREGHENAAGINLVGLKTFSFLSANNAKTTNYAPQDITLLILAIGNVLTSFSHGARGLGLVNKYVKRNRAYPEMLLNAAGFSAADIASHKAEYRNRYNYLVAKFNKIPLMSGIKYFTKCSELYHGYYFDEEGSDMCQTYIMVPESFWTYDEQSNPNGTILKTTQWRNTSVTAEGYRIQANFNDFLDDLEAQIDALLTSATLNYVYSDILRVHDKQNIGLLTLSEVPADYLVNGAKVEELSMWINNAVICGIPQAVPIIVPGGPTKYTSSNDVESDAAINAVVYRPQFAYPIAGLDLDFEMPINFKHESPTLEERIFATRLHASHKLVLDTGSNWPVSIDSALPDFYIVYINAASGIGLQHHAAVSAPYINPADDFMDVASLFSKFDWHPYVMKTGRSGSNYARLLGDLQYYTLLDYDVNYRIQEVAMMEELRLV